MKTFYIATALCLAVLATAQVVHSADPMARQVQSDEATLIRRKSCIGIGQCNDDSSHVNTEGAQIIINGGPGSSSSTSSTAASSSIASATATPVQTASLGGENTHSAAQEAADGALSSVSHKRVCLIAALTASLVGACILL